MDVITENANKPKSIPISITNQYSLKHGIFLPIQNSPPSMWKDRLLKRVNNMTNKM